MAGVDDLRIDGPVARPRRRGPSPTPWVLAAALALFIWWVLGKPLPQLGLPEALRSGPQSSQPTTPDGTAADGSAGGAVAVIPASAPAGSFSAGGYVEVIPPGPRAVSPLFAGKVAKLHCAPGDVVRQGQLLAELDSSLLRQEAAVLQARVDLAASQLKLSQAGFRGEEVLDAQAAVDRAQAAVASAQAQLSRAQADADRAERLYHEGVTPRANYDAAQAALAAAQAELGQAQAGLSSARALLELKQSGQRREEIGISESSLAVARAELGRIQQQVGLCQLKAPADGVVYALHVAEGGWVDPAEGGSERGAVLSLFDPRALQAYADVNQRDSARVSAGQAVELTTDAQPQSPIQGVVERIMPQANLQRNTVRVIIAIPDVPDYLKPEMNLKVVFLDDSVGQASAPAADEPQAGTPAPLEELP